MGKFGSGMKRSATFSVIGLAVLLGGCGGDAPKPSGSYTTGSIYAYMKAVQDDNGDVTTTVQLRDGPATTAGYLYLSSGETLYVNLEKPASQYMGYNSNLFSSSGNLTQNLKVMGSRDLYFDYLLFTQIAYGKPEYFAIEKSVAGTNPVRVYVDFERSGNVLTGTSTIDLPGGFQIGSPASAASLSRATPVSLSWTNADAATSMMLNVAGVCDDGNRYSMSKFLGTDTGSTTLTSADYFPATGVSTVANCQTAFMLQRIKLGNVAAQFAPGSSSSGIQQRSVRFTTTQ